MPAGTGSAADSGMGTTLVAGTSVFAMQLTSLKVNGVKRKAIDTSHMGTAAAASSKFGNMTFIASDLVDGGEVQCEGFAHTLQTVTTQQPPIGQAAETWTITWPKLSTDAVASTWAFTGFCTACDTDFPMEDIVKYSITLKVSGNVTVVAATT